jgi:hypothetical protein
MQGVAADPALRGAFAQIGLYGRWHPAQQSPLLCAQNGGTVRDCAPSPSRGLITHREQEESGNAAPFAE